MNPYVSFYCVCTACLHEVEGHGGLGHGDFEDGLVSRCSGAQVHQVEVAPWDGGLLLQHL